MKSDYNSFKKNILNESELFNEILKKFFFNAERPVYSQTGLHNPMTWAMGADDSKEFCQGGKRIRPCLGIMAAKKLGLNADLIIPTALAIELFHNFTLVHDDLEDGDRTRRNRDTVWVKFGDDIAINTGGYMLSMAFRVLDKIDDPVLKGTILSELAYVSEKTHIGQALDMTARGLDTFSMSRYYRTVLHKTGFCLGYSLVCAGMFFEKLINGKDDFINTSLVKSLKKFSLLSGVLFQIVDDVIDLSQGKGRGFSGSDIMEGKRSCLVALAMSSSDLKAEFKTELISILDTPRDKTTKQMIKRAVEIFNKAGVEAKSNKIIKRLKQKIYVQIEKMPNDLGNFLGDFTEYQCHRLI